MKIHGAIKFFAWLVLGVLGVCLGDWFFRFGFLHNENVKSVYIRNAKLDADVLIHGPCEPLWMINPEWMDRKWNLKSYNLALSHSDFADNYLHLYLYLLHQSKPKYLLLYVTPESMDEQYNTFHSWRFVPYLEMDTIRRVMKENDEKFAFFSNLPLLRWTYYNSKTMFNSIQGWKRYREGKTKPFFQNGFEPPAKVVWDNYLEEFKQLYPKGYQFKWSKKREIYLRRIVHLCRSEGVEIAWYESPVLEESKNSTKNRTEMIRRIQHLAQELKVPFYLFEGMGVAKSRENYISSLNLNLKQAEVFTDSLTTFLVEKAGWKK